MIVMTFLIQSSHRNLQLYSSGLSDFVVVLGDFEFNLTRFWNSKKPRSSHCGFFLVWCDSSRCVLAAVRRRLKDKKNLFRKVSLVLTLFKVMVLRNDLQKTKLSCLR